MPANAPWSRVLSPPGGRAGRVHALKAPERISPKHASILVTRAVDQMTEVQQRLFDRISAQCPDVIELRQMALAFRAALTGGDAAKLRLWVEGAKRCEYGPVARFAYGLRKDLLAVSAAVETSWSTGQVEGQINRLKMIKRQMYGRAGFHLLRARAAVYTRDICRAGSMTAPNLRKSPFLAGAEAHLSILAVYRVEHRSFDLAIYAGAVQRLAIAFCAVCAYRRSVRTFP